MWYTTVPIMFLIWISFPLAATHPTRKKNDINITCIHCKTSKDQFLKKKIKQNLWILLE